MKAAFASSVVCGGQARGKVTAATAASAAESAALARLTETVKSYRTLTSSGTPGPKVVESDPFWM